MKKRNLKSLNLNKKSVSSLYQKNLKGGLMESCNTDEDQLCQTDLSAISDC